MSSGAFAWRVWWQRQFAPSHTSDIAYGHNLDLWLNIFWMPRIVLAQRE